MKAFKYELSMEVCLSYDFGPEGGTRTKSWSVVVIHLDREMADYIVKIEAAKTMAKENKLVHVRFDSESELNIGTVI